jgi:hypothetical protein
MESHWPRREHFQCSSRSGCEKSCKESSKKKKNLRGSTKIKGFKFFTKIIVKGIEEKKNLIY